MTFIIPKATRITPEEQRERQYVEDIRQRAARMSEWEFVQIEDRLNVPYRQIEGQELEILSIGCRIRNAWSSTLHDLHRDPDSASAWNYLFERERELMQEDYVQHKARYYPEPAPAAPAPEPIALGTYAVAELRKAIRATRRGKDDILLRVASHGMFVSDWHRMLDNTVPQMLVMSRTGIIRSVLEATQHILITLPGMELSYPGKNGGILDIEADGNVTITIVGEYLSFECGKWTYRLKNWTRQ